MDHSSQSPNVSPGMPRLRLLAAALLLAAVVFIARQVGRGPSPPQEPVALPPTAVAPASASAEPWMGLPDRIEPTQFEPVDDPTADGWDTENLNKLANKQWKKLAHELDDLHVDAAHLRDLLAEGFTCSALRPGELAVAYKVGGIEVQRPVGEDDRTFAGADGFGSAMGELTRPVADTSQRRSKFKLYRIAVDEPMFTTEQLVMLTGQTPTGSVEINATWTATWTLPAGDAPPRLQSIRLDEYEQINVTHPNKTLFADCTEAALGHNPLFREQILYGANHWSARIEYPLGVDLLGLNGIALGDVNGDGLDDIYYTQAGALPNKLFVQNGDGTFDDRSAQAGVDFLERSHAPLLVDLDNDGDQDLIVSGDALLLVLSNDGQGRFKVEVRQELLDTPTSLSAVDYDNDGNVDLYYTVYYGRKDTIGEYPAAIPYHDATNGGRNVLLRNDGDWRFTDVTGPVGLDTDNLRFSFTSSWEDYDNDGDQDLYVANDFGRNNLFRNDGGKFVSVAGEAGVEDMAAGMSVSWGDFNNDGRPDVYVGNMFSAAGNRVTYQRKFKPGAGDEPLSYYRHHARGSSLFENLGDGTFADVSVAAGVTMGRWAWTSLLTDINNDGFEDILVANGNITGDNADDL